MWPINCEEKLDPIIYIPKKPRLPLDINIKTSRKWGGIVIHNSDSIDHPNINDFKGIVRYHTSYRIDYNIVTKDEFNRVLEEEPTKHKFEKPWRYVGYNGVIERDNDKLIYNYGRPLSTTGAHAGFPGNQFFNENFLGICICGDYDKNELDDEIYQFTLSIIRTFMDVFNIATSNVIGHREVYDRLGIERQKTCPGLKFNLNRMRGDL